jgi:predicted transcriptional regulator
MEKSQRIEIRASEEFLKKLEALAQEIKESEARVIQDAISLYEIALAEDKNGRGMLFVDKDKVDSIRDHLLELNSESQSPPNRFPDAPALASHHLRAAADGPNPRIPSVYSHRSYKDEQNLYPPTTDIHL